MRLRDVALCSVLGWGLCGCTVGPLGATPPPLQLPPSAAVFEPASLEVGVSRTATLTLHLSYSDFTRIDLSHGTGPGDVSLSDLTCDPVGSCAVQSVQTVGSQETVLALYEARAVSMRVTGHAIGSERVTAYVFGVGTCNSGGVCSHAEVYRTAEIMVTP